jgi:hypothetical protein
MAEDSLFMTQTMARIQEDQGCWADAAEIYRHLLNQDPQNPELRAGLRRAKSHLAARDETGEKKLAQVFEQWLDLLLLQRRALGLKRLELRLKR